MLSESRSAKHTPSSTARVMWARECARLSPVNAARNDASRCGERTPHRDASLRAAFTGLSLAHSRAHMTRAVLEGVCFALRDSLEILKELGLAPAVLLLTGGGAKNAFIRQLQADVFGLPVTTVNREEGGAYGAALLAAVGAGAFPDLQTAVQRTLARRPPAPPNPDIHRAYEEVYDRFRKRLVAARA